MRTDPARTWPIARGDAGELALLGVPQRLGRGDPPTRETFDQFLPLEAVGGEGWLAQVLAALLPRSLAWAWWAPSRAVGVARLSAGPMPSVVSPAALERVVSRAWFWKGVTL